MAHMNFQNVSKNHTHLKYFVNDMGPNAIVGVSESWLTPSDDMILWNVASNTHELFRSDRSSANSKRKGGVVMLFVPLELAPRERKDQNILDKTNRLHLGRM